MAESTYCTVAEVTTYAQANGHRAWLSLASQTIAGAVNNATGYASGAKSMAVDSFSDTVQPIAAGDRFTIATDSTATEYTVVGVVYNRETVQISFYPRLAESVADNDAINITSSQASAEQTRSVVLACHDIVRHHGQINSDSTLWKSDNTDLKQANIYQALHLANVLPMRERATAIREMTSDSFDDGEIVIQSVNNGSLDPQARFLVDKVVAENREEIDMNNELYQRGRFYGR